MVVIQLIASFVAICSLIYFWMRKKYSFFEENGFLFEKPTFPFGNLKGVGKDFHVVYKTEELYNKFKGKAKAFGMYFFTSPVTVVTDLETVKHVLVRDFDAFYNRGTFNNEKDDPLTCHLFSIEDAKWKNLRHKLTPTFTSGKMKMMFDTVMEISDLMVQQIERNLKSEAIEMKDALAQFTTDVIGNVAFGLEMNTIAEPDSMFRKMGKKIFKQDSNLQIKSSLLTSYRNMARKLRLRFLPTDVSDFFLKTIQETVDYRRENKIERNDVIDLLLKIKADDGSGLTLNEIAAQCFIFFIGGT